ncbi:MAG: NAD-dependent deacylase [Planctomycetes bacterium]|nr:NAD-dependent deacylase [Planctomycetota bacterium]
MNDSAQESPVDRPLGPGDHLVVLTGAGISADSGLATFRGGGGLWEGHRVEDVATPEAWQRDPQTVWRFYQMRRAALLDVQPNPGHRALAELENAARERGFGFTLISQNVDDLHQRSGSTVLPMHGQLLRLRCEVCGYFVHGLEHLDPDRFLACPACEHPTLRPDIVWFGEIPHHLEEISEAMASVTHFLASGTSGAVYPAAGLLSAARSVGARTFVNALEAPENLGPRDEFLPGSASEVLPGWVERMLGA